jgi:simple sugar transport system permease protein
MSTEKSAAKKPVIKDANFARMLVVFIVVFAICSLLQGGNFLNKDNFLGMFRQFPEYGLLAIGIGMALIIGGIDLSAVYLANLASIVAGQFVLKFYDGESYSLGLVLFSFLIAILVGAIGGAINGVLISGLGIPAMLATLGTQSLFWGFGVVLTKGSTLSGFPRSLGELINKKFGILPITVIIFAVAAIIAGLVVQKTKLGREMKMYGTNSKATVYAGLNNFKIVVCTHIFSGVLAALSGIIMWGRYSSAKADTGSTYTMQAILIAVMGGVSPNGGKGSVTGIILAVLIIQMVSSTLNMYQSIPNACRQIVWGGLLIVVMILNYYIDLRARKKH